MRTRSPRFVGLTCEPDGPQGSERRSARQIALLLAAIVFLVPCGRADLDPTRAISQYIHQIWTDEQGLPQNNVLAITQTRDGYLWLGTEEGLARFDGVRFSVFDSRNTPELKNYISALFEDRDGNLWIGIQGGLVRFSHGIFAAINLPGGLQGKLVSSLYEDTQGGLWVGTDGGGVGRLVNSRFTTYTTNDGLASNAAFSITGDHDGSVWIGTHGGLNRWHSGKLTTYSTQNGLPNDDVRAVFAGRNGDIWIGTQGGLGRLRNGIFSNFTKSTGLSTDLIHSLYQDREDTLWIGSLGGGLARYRDGKFTTYTMREGLSGDDVMSISGDREGNLWVGTGAAGLNRFSQAKVSSFTSTEGLPSNIILATYEDPHGDLWIGTADRGLSRIRDGKVKTYSTKQGLSNDTVFSVVEDLDHNLWIGTRKGINRWKNGKFTAYAAKDGMAGDNVIAALVDRDGTLWAGGRGGLSVFRNGKFTSLALREGSSSFLVTSLAQDQSGALWIGTDSGIYRLVNGQLTYYTTRNSGLSNDYVFSLHVDPEGILWIGTDGGGLNRLKDGKITSYSSRVGLFDDRVMQTLDGDDGNLWMSSNRGIFYVKKQQLNDFAEGKIRSISSGMLGAEEGMKSKECNGGFQQAGWKTRSGKLLFPTVKGVAIVDPRHLEIDSFVPQVVIERVTVDKQNVPVDATAIVPPGRGELDFQYTAPVFINPEKIRFQYQLEGNDRDWVDAIDRRVAHYTNIPAGHYRFRVRVRNGDGRWNDVGVAFSLVLKPHFYRTYWFYALCIMTGLALVFSLLRARMNQLKVRERHLVSLVDQRTQELQSEIIVRKRTEEDLKQARDQAIQARDELHFQASHDALTGIWSRRAIMDLLNLEIERANRSQSTVGVLMLDVDHFKAINDTHGHPVGDLVLRQVTRRISQAIRSYDSAGRYGGEEFLVVLPGCDKSHALQSAERIRSAIADHPISAGEAEMRVTISIGATVPPTGIASATKVLAAADAALYLAKNGGRNRTAACDCEMPVERKPRSNA